MPALTRRRSADAREDCWHIYYGDVHAGTIAMRNGNPHDTDPWEWACGFYPGSHPGESTSGTSETFEQARTDFEAAWAVLLSKRTEADLQAWRDQQDAREIPPLRSRRAYAARLEAVARCGWLMKLPQGWQRPFRRSHSPAPRSPARYAQARRRIHPEAAVEALLLVVELNGPTMMARIGVTRTLNRGYIREYDSSRKDTHWGQRKLKRDRG
jgi:hypothetical protein